MAKQLFANNASALLAASISDSDVTIQVASGFGSTFPSPGSGEYALVTLENADGDIEIVKYESRSGDLLQTCTRGQEGTAAQAWTGGQARVEARLTKGSMENLLQRGGDEMSGDLNMNENEVQDAILTGSGTKMTEGQIIAVPLRGAEDDSSNQILVPDDGTRATAGGAAILCAGDDLADDVFTTGMIMMWYGAAAECPTGWVICDGTNDTPDMRDKFPVGAGSSYALDATGGSATASGSTSSSGAHTHGDATGSTALTTAQMPSHNHELYAVNNAADSNADGWQSTNSMAVPGEDVGPFAYRDANGGGTKLIKAAGSGDGHTHGISSDGGHTHTLASVATIPPYRALHFIMKT